MSRFLRDRYKSIETYTPGEQINDKTYIKLNTNESPFEPSEKVREAIDSKTVDKLNLYSDPTLSVLTEAISKSFGVKNTQVFCANGSDDVLAFALWAFCSDGELVCPDISYGFYPVFADLFGIKLSTIPLKSDFSIDVNDYIGIGKNIVIANPNAPTGLSLCIDDIEKIVSTNPDNVVIIDEAYVDFCDDSCVSLLSKYDNLVVTQTFSKSRSLAGLRVGFALSNESIIKDMNKMRFSFNPYNVNTLSLKAAAAAIADSAYYDDCINEIVNTREFFKQELRKRGYTVIDSKTNFVFTSHPTLSSKQLYTGLKSKGVLIRYFDKQRINNFVRITVGKKLDMETTLQKLDELTEETEGAQL